MLTLRSCDVASVTEVSMHDNTSGRREGF